MFLVVESNGPLSRPVVSDIKSKLLTYLSVVLVTKDVGKGYEQGWRKYIQDSGATDSKNKTKRGMKVYNSVNE